MPAQIDFTKIDTLPQNLSKDEVKRLQKFLNEQGYSVKSPTSKGTGVDGVMGQYTQNAWDSYVQSRNAQSQAAETKKTITLPSAVDAKAIVNATQKISPSEQYPAEQLMKQIGLEAKDPYDVTGPEIEAAGVTATQNKTLKPIDMLNLGQVEMHKDRVNAIKGIGKTGEEDTTETTTTTENPTATQTFDQAMADRSYLQSLFDDRRKAAEKERTNQLALASYNSLGNALRSLAQPIGWVSGQSTVGVQPYDNRAYLDAFNRAVAAGNDLWNIDSQVAKFLINRAYYDRRQAEELEKYKA